jgi:hypothetical protein
MYDVHCYRAANGNQIQPRLAQMVPHAVTSRMLIQPALAGLMRRTATGFGHPVELSPAQQRRLAVFAGIVQQVRQPMGTSRELTTPNWTCAPCSGISAGC